MSKHSPAQRSGLSSAENGIRGTASSAGAHATYLQGQSTLPPTSQAQRSDVSNERPRTLPPLSRQSSMTDESSDQSRQGRAFGVHSILNPLQAETHEPRGVRRKADELEESSPSLDPASTRPESLASVAPSRAGSVEISPASSQTGYNSLPGLPRRILSPRSQVPRLASLSTLRTPTATLPVHDNPFLAASAGPTSAVESTSGHPPLPTPPAAARQGYGFPAAPTPPIPESRRPSGAITGPIHSSSASPSTQLSTHSHASRTSPATLLGMPPEQAPSSHPSTTSTPGPHDRDRPQGIPVSSTGHSSYQLMTFNTVRGAVQFPVDVQAASRAADDKRRRNAGASARFRARRKEKEREASTTISRLEQQLKDAKEDADFYRREREYLTTVLLRTPSGDQHFPRPMSPRHRRDRASSESGGGSGSGSGSYASPFQSQRHPSVSASYSPTAAAAPPPAAVARASYQSAYPPLQDTARQPGQIPRSVAPPNHHQQLPQPTPPAGPHRPTSYDPYRQEGYDRSWPPHPAAGGR